MKVLRTQSYAALLKKDNLKQAVLDNATRWDSTYLMLIRLYELKKFCDDHCQINYDLNISETNWERFKNMVNILFILKLIYLILSYSLILRLKLLNHSTSLLKNFKRVT